MRQAANYHAWSFISLVLVHNFIKGLVVNLLDAVLSVLCSGYRLYNIVGTFARLHYVLVLRLVSL